MGIKDQHDPRSFQHFAKFAEDGTIAAIVEVADGQPEPDDDDAAVYVDVTDLHPFDVREVSVPRAQVAAAKDARPTKKDPPPDSPTGPPARKPPTRNQAAQDARRTLKAALTTAHRDQRAAKESRG